MILSLILAIVMPWAAGIGILGLISLRRGAGKPHELVQKQLSPSGSQTVLYGIAAGYFLGQIVVAAALYTTLCLTGSSQSRIILGLLMALTAVCGWYIQRSSRRSAGKATEPGTPARSSATSRLIVAVIGILLLAKFVATAATVESLPLLGDDAISIWLYRAKVITALDAMPLDPAHPYYLGGSTPTYPVFCSLMAAWIPLVTGEWTEPLAAVPWMLTWLSLICIIAGGLAPRCGTTTAWLAAYAAASLPLMAVHVCRPGYADLPLAAFLAAATMQMLRWRRTATTADFLLAVVFALAAALMKREGPALAILVIAPILLCGHQTLRAATARSLTWMALSLAAAVLTCGALLDFTEQRAALSAITWQPGVASALLRHAFQWGSFSLLFPLAFISLAVVTFHPNAAHQTTTIITCLLLIGFVACIFLLTPQGRFALNDQTPSRLILQIAPTIIVLLASSLGALRYHDLTCKT